MDGPLAIAAAEVDQSLNTTRRHEVEDILLKRKVGFQSSLYAGVAHGFAVRADVKNRTQLFAKEAAFWQAVLWFDDWL
jgi:dienelactone hydrolase